MDDPKSRKIEHFMRASALLDRSFFVAFMLVCVGVLALCVSLYLSASTSAYNSYMRKVQCSTMSLSAFLESYVARMIETQRSFIGDEGAAIDDEGFLARLEVLSGTLAPDGVRATIFLSPEGEVLNAFPRNMLAGHQELLKPYLAKMAQYPGSMITTPPVNVGGARVVCLMSPVLEKEGNGLSGILCYVVDIDFVAKRIFRDVTLGDYEYVWVFDQSMHVVYEQGSVPTMGGGRSFP
ncbi:MAG: cache domain-containing protein [Victivallales bacterium]|nr:cache domain-containing protein [Victivallales bacterium]